MDVEARPQERVGLQVSNVYRSTLAGPISRITQRRTGEALAGHEVVRSSVPCADSVATLLARRRLRALQVSPRLGRDEHAGLATRNEPLWLHPPPRMSVG
jgi:hypothetical protein